MGSLLSHESQEDSLHMLLSCRTQLLLVKWSDSDFPAFFLLLLQKLAFYSKMQEAADSTNISGTFSVHGSAIKEEDSAGEKERPPEAEYLSSRCVLFTYFQGDISSVVDEHFTRALSQASYAPASSGSKTSRGSTSSWRGGFSARLKLTADIPLL